MPTSRSPDRPARPRSDLNSSRSPFPGTTRRKRSPSHSRSRSRSRSPPRRHRSSKHHHSSRRSPSREHLSRGSSKKSGDYSKRRRLRSYSRRSTSNDPGRKRSDRSFSDEDNPKRHRDSVKRRRVSRSRSRSPAPRRRDRSPPRRRDRLDLSSSSPPPRRYRHDDSHSPPPRRRRRSPSSSRSPPPRKRSPSPNARPRKPLPAQEVSFRGGDTPGEGGVVGPPIEKQKPNFANTGLLAKEANTVPTTGDNKIVLKYNEPPEARKPPPSQAWRLYVFKGAETLKTIQLYTESVWLIGREAAVADILVEHPSCSKQHAVIQFRHSVKVNEFGDRQSRVRPYLIDLDSANGTKLNGETIAGSRYVEVKDGDVVKFGLSEREYVFMLPPQE